MEISMPYLGISGFRVQDSHIFLICTPRADWLNQTIYPYRLNCPSNILNQYIA